MRDVGHRRRLGAVLAATLMCGSVVACGENRAATSETLHLAKANSRTTPMTATSIGGPEVGHRRIWDHDGDPGADIIKKNSPYDHDDRDVSGFGSAAGRTDAREIGALVGRYYLDVAADNGAAACSLLTRGLAEGLVELQDPSAGASHAVVPDCAAFVAKELKGILGRSPGDLLGVKLIGARVKRADGIALLRLRSDESRYIRVRHEGGAWKIESLIDSEFG